MQDFVRQAKAVVIGHAVGDALGVPAEFCPRGYLDLHPVTDMVGYGSHPVPAGTWSDDTSMSLCALKALAEGFNLERVMQNFEKWLYEGYFTPMDEAFDVGGTCQCAISRFHEGTPYDKCGPDDENSNGNGSLMRIHPFSMYLYHNAKDRAHGLNPEEIELIAQASSLTHAHPRSTLACVIYSFILWELLKNPCKESVKVGLERVKKIYEPLSFRVRERLELPRFARLFEGMEHYERDSVQSTGYVLHTLEASVWCLMTTDNYRDCVLNAVNLGRDADTTAAVAGGLAGALYGYDAIPESWKNAIAAREHIEQLCENAYTD